MLASTDTGPPPAARLTRGDALAAVGAALVGFAFFALNVDFVLFGDAAMYADYVVRRQFDELTLHLGYYWLLAGADALTGLPINETMAWLDVAAGAVTLGLTWLLVQHLTDDRRAAALAVLMLAVSGRMLMNATSAEVYMTQTAFMLAAFVLYARDHAFWAGVASTATLLVSPLSAFAFLFFPAEDLRRHGRLRWPLLLRLAAPVAVCYGAFLIVNGHELLFGVRGLLDIRDLLPPSPAELLANAPRYQVKAFTALSLLLVPAAVVAWRRERRPLLWLTLAVALPHLYIIVKLTAEDNVFLLPTDPFQALWMALGALALRDWLAGPTAGATRRALATALALAPLAAHLGLYVASGTLFSGEHRRGQAPELEAFAREQLTGKDAAVITDWGTAQALVFVGRTRATMALRKEPLMAQVIDIDNPAPDDARRLAAGSLYLLDAWQAAPLSRLLESRAAQAERRRRFSTLGRAERELGVSCTLLRDGYARLYRCAQGSAA